MFSNTEKYYRLKYYYWINPDDILSKIKESNAYQFYQEEASSLTPDPEAFEDLLDMIFETIFEATLPYTNYLNPECCFDHFFGENDIYLKDIPNITEPISLNRSYTAGAQSLMKLSLFNHLVITTYFQLFQKLQPKSFSLTKEFHHYFNHGFFELNSMLESGDLFPAGKEHCDDYRMSYNNRMKNYDSMPAEYHSKRILETICTRASIKRKKPSYHLTFPDYLHQFAYFLYTNRTVHCFDKNISASNPLNDIHTSTYKQYMDRISTLNLGRDKLLFSYPIQKIYGFNTLFFYRKLLSQIHNSSTDIAKRNFSDLNDSKFLALLEQTFHCPMVFSRAFFFKYACETIIWGELTDTRFLSQSPNIAIKKTPKNWDSKITTLEQGFILLEKFIYSINQLVLPLIQDIWDVLTEELGFSLEVFSSYIDHHYEDLTADYTLFSYPQIAECYDNKFQETRLRAERFNITNPPVRYSTMKLTTDAKKQYNQLLNTFFSPQSQSLMNVDFQKLCDIEASKPTSKDSNINVLRNNHAVIVDSITTSPFLSQF